MVKKYDFNFGKIRKELIEKSVNLLDPICNLILKLNLLKKSIFQKYEKIYETIDFLYDLHFQIVQSNLILNQKYERTNKNITQEFYNGFGNDI